MLSVLIFPLNQPEALVALVARIIGTWSMLNKYIS